MSLQVVDFPMQLMTHCYFSKFLRKHPFKNNDRINACQLMTYSGILHNIYNYNVIVHMNGKIKLLGVTLMAACTIRLGNRNLSNCFV